MIIEYGWLLAFLISGVGGGGGGNRVKGVYAVFKCGCEVVYHRNGVLYKILTHLAYIANGKKTCYIVQQFHRANKRDVTLRHL